jgi:hypothetical protein
MADQKHEGDHWRELAELFGLPGDAVPPAKEVAPPSAPAPEPATIKAYEEPRSLPVHSPPVEEALHEPLEEHEAPTIPMPREEEPPTEWEGEMYEDMDETPIEGFPGEAPAVSEEAEADQPGVPGEEEKPRRGKRRRRRGRRRGGDRGEPDASRTTPAVRDGESESRDRRDRGRGRRGHDEEPRQERPHAEEASEMLEERPARAHNIPSSDTDFSDWNVPSWQDLIASLYRPDR